MNFLRNNRRVIAALAVVLGLVFTVSYTSRQRDGATLLETFLIELLAPVQDVAEWATLSVETTVRGIAQLRQLQEENQQLREQLAEMAQLELELNSLRRENTDLKRIVGLVQGDSGDFEDGRIITTAQVIGRNPDNWFRYVEINKGQQAGVAVDMVAIVPPRILVGRVIRVTPRTATVMLLTDPESGVGGLGQTTRDAGVVLGTTRDDGLLEMQLFSRDASPYKGQVVVTSGLGGIFPRNLLIGTVKELGYARQGVLPLAYVNPFADLDRLDYLVIVQRLE